MSTVSQRSEEQTLPWFVFGLMARVALVGILSELAPSDILPQITAGLGIEESEVGFLVGVYALAQSQNGAPELRTYRFCARKPDVGQEKSPVTVRHRKRMR